MFKATCTAPQDVEPEVSSIDGDTLDEGDFALQLEPEKQRYSMKSKSVHSFQLPTLKPPPTMRFGFWYRWLFIASLLFAVLGILVALAPDNLMLTSWKGAAAQHFFDGTMPADARALESFLLGPLGATIAGFYVLQVFIVWNAFWRREPWAWWAVALATLLWFVVDSIRSLQHGALFNIWMINVPALAVIALPLAMTWADFQPAT